VKHELLVDTNIFLRFLTNDDPIKAKKAEALFKAAVNGKQRLRTSLLVIAEIAWTLESFYELPKEDIANKIFVLVKTVNTTAFPSGKISSARQQNRLLSSKSGCQTAESFAAQQAPMLYG